MVGAHFIWQEGVSLGGVSPADDGEIVAKRREWFQGVGKIEAAALFGGAPIVSAGPIFRATGRAMHHFDACQASPRGGGCSTQRRLRGEHRIQQGQGQGSTQPMKNRPPG